MTGDRILVKSQFEIREGDFVISKRQIVHGACAVVSKKYEGATVSNEYDVMNCKNGLLSSFFDYYVQLPFIKRYFYTASDGVHIEKLRFKTCDWLRQKVRVPSITEQQKIVSILCAWDRAIELKKQFITQKKQQKKWLMENLLTGKKRIPGFTGDWQELRLGELGILKSGSVFPEEYQNNTNYDIPFYKVSDLGNLNNKLWLTTSNHCINDTICKKINAFVFPANTIVFAKIGAALFLERKRLLRYDSCIDNNMMGLNVDVSKSDYLFVYYLLEMKRISQFYNDGPLPSLSTSSIANISVCLPVKPEQTAIAEILSAADREIDLHEKQLEELKKQKKALMQLLLTGIVRVNAQEVS